MLPPFEESYNLKDRLEKELQSLRTRRNKLVIYKRSIREFAVGIKKSQLLLKVARRIVIRKELYKDDYRSIK